MHYGNFSFQKDYIHFCGQDYDGNLGRTAGAVRVRCFDQKENRATLCIIILLESLEIIKTWFVLMDCVNKEPERSLD